jgi:hypothetical protein
MFDHVPPPVPPAGTTNEFVDGLPIGLGFRGPANIVSPWSVGGYVCDNPRPTIPAVNEPIPEQSGVTPNPIQIKVPWSNGPLLRLPGQRSPRLVSGGPRRPVRP